MGSSSPLKMQLEFWNYCHGNMHSGVFGHISSLYPIEALPQRVVHKTFLPFHVWGLPFSMYAPGGGEGVQASYTFPLCITCKKGGRGSRKHIKLRMY